MGACYSRTTGNLIPARNSTECGLRDGQWRERIDILWLVAVFKILCTYKSKGEVKKGTLAECIDDGGVLLELLPNQPRPPEFNEHAPPPVNTAEMK
jgi:hypothetical protein